MPGNQPNDRQPGEHAPTRAGAARPSLVAASDTATPAGGDERPMRMLDALQGSSGTSPRRAAARPGGSGRWPWMPGVLVMAIGSALAVGLMNTGESPAEPTAAADGAAAPPAATTAPPPTGPASDTAPAAGPAKVEAAQTGLAALPGMEAAAAAQHAVATSPAASAAASSLQAAQAVRTAQTAGAAPRPPKRPARAAARPRADAQRPMPRRPSASVPAATTGDPDAELVAAIMARLEARGAAAMPTRVPERGSTIAALVSDCQALPDPANALACRRRICDGYWGKAQACPKSLAPANKARTTTAAADAGEPVSR